MKTGKSQIAQRWKYGTESKNETAGNHCRAENHERVIGDDVLIWEHEPKHGAPQWFVATIVLGHNGYRVVVSELHFKEDCNKGYYGEIVESIPFSELKGAFGWVVNYISYRTFHVTRDRHANSV